MPTLHVEAQLSSEELLRAIRQLSPSELEQLIAQIMALRAQLTAPQLSPPETDLLLRINQGLPEEWRQRYNTLVAKRRAQTLTPDEHGELLRLTDEVEKLEGARLEALVELAKLRQTSLPSLMQTLGIPVPVDA